MQEPLNPAGQAFPGAAWQRERLKNVVAAGVPEALRRGIGLAPWGRLLTPKTLSHGRPICGCVGNLMREA